MSPNAEGRGVAGSQPISFFFICLLLNRYLTTIEGITETQLIKMTKYAIHITFLI
jgi:hypothetical protein